MKRESLNIIAILVNCFVAITLGTCLRRTYTLHVIRPSIFHVFVAGMSRF